jgi:hypothetical protein
MKTLLLACLVSVAFASDCFAQQSSYWVVGNRANGKCDIVTQNPVIYGDGYTSGYWFGDGPYQSLDDAKLARSTIGACPKSDPARMVEDSGAPR